MRLALGSVATVLLTAATASGAPVVSITEPSSGALVDGTLDVKGSIMSTYAVTEVKASVSSVTKDAFYSAPSFSTTLTTSSLAYGSYTLTVTAKDTIGASGSATVPILIDRPPSIAVTAPVQDAVVPTTTSISATCTDDGPSGCTSIKASVDGTVVATGTTSLSGTISLATWAGRAIALKVEAVDARGQVSTRIRSVTVSGTLTPPAVPGLTAIAALPGKVIDFDGTRAIYLSAPETSAYVRPITSSTQTVMYSGTDTVGRATLVGSTYAALETGTTAYEWDGTTLTSRGQTYAAGSSKIAFSVTNTSGGGTLIVRDPALGSSVLTVADASVTPFPRVMAVAAPNDDVVWNNVQPGDIRILRWRSGTTTMLSSSSGVVPLRTDGVNVAWTRTFTGGGEELVLQGVGTLCTGTALTYTGGCHDFAMRGGWMAYPTPVSGVRQVARRSPSGTIERISVFTAASTPEDVSPSGQVLYTSGGRRYLANDGMSAPRDVSPATGRSLFLSGAWYLLIDNNIYRIDATPPGDAGPGDTGPADTGSADSSVGDTGAAADTAIATDTSTAGDTATESDSGADTAVVDSSTEPLADATPVADSSPTLDAPDAEDTTPPPAEEAGGCSTTPGRTTPGAAALFGLLALIPVLGRRRRVNADVSR